MNPRRERNPALSATFLPPKKPPRKARPTVVVGFDTEYRADQSLLSVQFAIVKEGELVSRVYDPPAARLTPLLVVGLLQRLFSDVGLHLADRNRQRVTLVSHFAAAELGTFEDALRDLRIRQAGKAHHASFAEEVDGVHWHVRILDLFGYFQTSLKKVGKVVGLEKIDEDPALLEELRAQDRARFDRYASRDAEIAVSAFHRLREWLAQWDIDILLTSTISAAAGLVFKYNFLTRAPTPSRIETRASSRRAAGGWKATSTNDVLYAGLPAIRDAAHRAYHGGHAQALVRGLVVGPVVELDAISLWPSAALLQPLPNEKTRWVEVNDLDQLAELEGFVTVDFRFPPDCQYPCLPTVPSNGDGLQFPRSGVSDCAIAEARVALKMGAHLRLHRDSGSTAAGWGFRPNERERAHDVGRYLRRFLADKAAAETGGLDYAVAKAMLNGLLGKFSQYAEGSDLLAMERKLRQDGQTIADLGSAREIRAAARKAPREGSLFAPEWVTLVVGRGRALMAEIVAKGAMLVSTDAIFVRPDINLDCEALTALKSVDSGFRTEVSGDAAFIARARLYAILRRPENVRPDDEVFARNETWCVVRVAKHGSRESDEEFAATVLQCLADGRDVAEPRSHTRLLSADTAIKARKRINAEVTEERTTRFNWDRNRRLNNARVNIFTHFTETSPYDSVDRQQMAGNRTAKNKKRRKAKDYILVKELLRQGLGVRAVARQTATPVTTVSNIKKRLNAAQNGQGCSDWSETTTHRRNTAQILEFIANNTNGTANTTRQTEQPNNPIQPLNNSANSTPPGCSDDSYWGYPKVESPTSGDEGVLPAVPVLDCVSEGPRWRCGPRRGGPVSPPRVLARFGGPFRGQCTVMVLVGCWPVIRPVRGVGG